MKMIPVELKLMPLAEPFPRVRGIYVFTMKDFGDAPVYVGTAGEGADSSIAKRVAQNKKNFYSGKGSLYRYSPADIGGGTPADFVKFWLKIVQSKFDPSLTYIPGIPSGKYSLNEGEAEAYWNFQRSMYYLEVNCERSDLRSAFGSNSRILKAFEAKFQNLVRGYYGTLSPAGVFPVGIRIPKVNSLFLGQTHATNAADSEHLVITDVSCPSSSNQKIWLELATFARAQNATGARKAA